MIGALTAPTENYVGRGKAPFMLNDPYRSGEPLAAVFDEVSDDARVVVVDDDLIVGVPAAAIGMDAVAVADPVLAERRVRMRDLVRLAVGDVVDADVGQALTGKIAAIGAAVGVARGF